MLSPPQDTVWVAQDVTRHNAFTYTEDPTRRQLKAMDADGSGGWFDDESIAIAWHMTGAYEAWDGPTKLCGRDGSVVMPGGVVAGDGPGS